MVSARNVGYDHVDIPGSAGDPDFPGRGLGKFISTPAYLKMETTVELSENRWTGL